MSKIDQNLREADSKHLISFVYVNLESENFSFPIFFLKIGFLLSLNSGDAVKMKFRHPMLPW